MPRLLFPLLISSFQQFSSSPADPSVSYPSVQLSLSRKKIDIVITVIKLFLNIEINPQLTSHSKIACDLSLSYSSFAALSWKERERERERERDMKRGIQRLRNLLRIL